MRQLKLDTPRDIRQSLTRVANLVLNGELEPKRANCITYIASIVLSSIRVDEYGKDLEEVKEMLQELEALRS